jgi:Ca2+-binding EF-hand superfamily protein
MSTADIDWEAIGKKLPYERTEEAFKARSELFNLMDPNGNGYLSLAEVDKGLRDILQIDEIFDAKPAIMRAFQAAKNYMPSNAGTPGADYVQRKEFRILLQFLRHYFELWVMFEALDTGEDRRVNFEEFQAAIPKLAEWGVYVAEGEAEDTFNKIDSNDGGQILFAEFCSWAIKHKLDLGEEDNNGDSPELSMTVEEKIKASFERYDTDGNGVITPDELSSLFSALDPDLNENEVKQIVAVSDANKDGVIDFKEFVDWLFNRKGGGKGGKTAEKARAEEAVNAIDWNHIAEELPYERTPEAKEKRKKLFSLFDPNGNGYLSLAEVDKGIRDILRVDDLFHAKPAIMRAFQAAKNAAPAAEGSPGEDYVTFREFRIFLQYLRLYFELWVMFQIIDAEGDRRINLEEFKAMRERLIEWGANVPDEGSEETVFNEIDSNNGGQILFNEFCRWAIKQKLDLDEEDD